MKRIDFKHVRGSVHPSVILGAALALASCADTPPAISSRVAEHNGRPTIFINDHAEYPMVYALTDVPGGRWSWEELPQHNIKSFWHQGVRLFQIDLFLDHLWHEDGRFDITPARRQIQGILEVCPEAAVFFRFHVTAPRWWMHRHPEEWVKYADTDYVPEDTIAFPRIIESDNFPVSRVSMASLPWREQATEKLKEFLRELSDTDEGRALAGIQVANGVYGEWHNWGFYWHEPDVSEPMSRVFRSWLRRKYATDDALRAAWGNASVSLATAAVPGMEQRSTGSRIFRDPKRERQAIDYYTCAHELVADNILHFARVVKESWPRPIITGTFYGYYFSAFGRQASGGHLELHRLLRSEHLDYLSGPQAYGPEAIKLGEPYRSRSLITSVRLNGKLWLDEMDVEPQTPILRDTKHDLRLQNSIADVRRNVFFSFTKGMGLWFYDFGVSGVDLDGFQYNWRGSKGNWDHPGLLADIARAKRLMEERMGQAYRTGADVLFVFDTESFYHTASLRGSDPVSNVLIDHNTLNAFKSGVVFDPIHIKDLELIDLSPYRVVVFGNTYLLNDRQREYIRSRVATDGRTIVWFYAPGYLDGSGRDVDQVSALTGIQLSEVTLPAAPEILLALPDGPAVRYRVGTERFSPLFAVVDLDATVVGSYAGTRLAAVARKVLKDHIAWYVSLPNTGIEPMRHILRTSGAHVYANDGEIVYAGSGVISVHTGTGGRHAVTLRSGRRLDFELPEGASTLVIDAETGTHLLPQDPVRRGGGH